MTIPIGVRRRVDRLDEDVQVIFESLVRVETIQKQHSQDLARLKTDMSELKVNVAKILEILSPRRS